jgi:multidrug efflux pump subunit AcrB
MERITRWFVQNRVAANMMMIFIIIAGFVTIPYIKMEVFPAIEVDIINVSIIYPGASPSDIEESICVRVEERLQGLEGIKKITSTASENLAVISVEILPEQVVEDMLDKVKAQVDAINTFPDDIEKPTVQQIIAVSEVITIAVDGNLDEDNLINLTEMIKDDIDALPGITYTTLVGKKNREIEIEISEKTLRKYGLSLEQISRSINSWSIDLPSGSIESDNGEILIRAKNQGYSVDDFNAIPVITDEVGSVVRLGDISNIHDDFVSNEYELQFNGNDAKLIRVFRVGDQNALDISKSVRDYIDIKTPDLPPGVHLTPWNDEALLLQGRIDLLTDNAKYGLFFVLLVLALFLKPKLAFWISLGIPISFMGGFWFMPIMDLSINMLSLFTFILVLGIVVDDAIVVGENIALFRERGLDPEEAAVKGAAQVTTPVIFAVLTTMVTFSPMLAVAGTIGAIWRIFPLITIIVLFWSLIESLTILPAHLAHSVETKPKNNMLRSISERWDRFQDKVKKFLEDFVERRYKPMLLLAVKHPLNSLALAISIFVLTLGMILSGVLKFSFFPPIEGDIAIATIEYPSGTPIEVTRDGFNVLNQAAHELNKQLLNEYPSQNIIHNILSTVGDQPMRTKTSQGPGALNVSFDGSNLAEVALELAPGESRSISTETVVKRWREMVSDIPGVKQLSFFSSLFSAGDPVNIQLSSKYMDDLFAARDELKEKLIEYPGVFNVQDDFNMGKEELIISLLPAAENYGVTMQMVAFQVRQAFYGLEAQSIQRGRDELKVMLRYPDEERSSISNLEDMMIRTPKGSTIPIRQIAQLDIGEGVSTIKRKDRKRSISVTADVDLTVTTGNEVISSVTKDVLPSMMQRYSSLSYSLEGEQQEQGQNLSSLARNAFVAMVVVYTLLAIPFGSYLQPLVVMSAIPFGLTGAVIGHLIMGINFSVLSLLGIVALTGVVVNDSLVMVDFINKYREEGSSIEKAVLEAGPRRFRPIFMTSLTTFAGLTPLLFEKSIQAKFIIPMAVSLAFGVIFATVITLFLVPISYLILEKYLLKSGE